MTVKTHFPETRVSLATLPNFQRPDLSFLLFSLLGQVIEFEFNYLLLWVALSFLLALVKCQAGLSGRHEPKEHNNAAISIHLKTAHLWPFTTEAKAKCGGDPLTAG